MSKIGGDNMEGFEEWYTNSIDDVMYEDQNVVPNITFYDGEKEIGL